VHTVALLPDETQPGGLDVVKLGKLGDEFGHDRMKYRDAEQHSTPGALSLTRRLMSTHKAFSQGSRASTGWVG
jgi:hypothetical protein